MKYLILIIDGQEQYFFGGMAVQPKLSKPFSAIKKTKVITEAEIFEGETLYTVGTKLQFLTTFYPEYIYNVIPIKPFADL